MSEQTRGLIYRGIALAFILYAIVTRPDTIEDVLPVLLGIVSSGLATKNTSIR